ncbi:MAG: radical SAM protein [Kiritimatiellae bacterium]|nr:radical SAM protein [Kiritimatiellia bacterium]
MLSGPDHQARGAQALTGRIFEIREFTLQDGPGPRTTVFLQGCPLRCAWCHNPEGQDFAGGRETTAAAVADEILKTADFLAGAGGGVTFSGGEPLAQADFVVAVVDRLRAAEPRLTFAAETSGYAPAATYQKVVSALDVVLQDVKCPDLDGDRRWTGVDAAPVFENLSWLKRSGVPFVARVPCSPGVNDTREAKAGVARLLADAPNLLGVELLPYNALAAAKYAKLGRVYAPAFDTASPSDLSPGALAGLPGIPLCGIIPRDRG